MERAEERSLIEAAMTGDRGAADRLIRAHQGPVYAYMLRMAGKPDIAEDIVQEAFVRVLTNLQRFDFNYRFSTWLFTIARRLYLNRQQKLSPVFDTDFIGAARSQRPAHESRADDHEMNGRFREALQWGLMKLSSDQREILVLFHQQNWPIALIAKHLDIPEGTVKSHLHRGRRRLRQVLTSAPELADALDIEQYAPRPAGAPERAGEASHD